MLAARDADVKVHHVDIHPDDCTLNLNDFQNKLSEKTQLVAIGAASNSAGNVNPLEQITRKAHQAGAKVFVDAVHYAPHRLIDVPKWDCDFLVCSAYKFFGPHVGMLWGRREFLEALQPYKLRPAPEELPGRWMTGTQNHAALMGVRGAIDYLATIGKALSDSEDLSRRQRLQIAFQQIQAYEEQLTLRLLNGLKAINEITVYGITQAERIQERMPTLICTHQRYTSRELAEQLSERGIYAWHGNYYALQLSERLNKEPEGMLRLGLVHYNTDAEVDRCLDALASF